MMPNQSSKVIFLGDIAVPGIVTPIVSEIPWGESHFVIANLEGAFANDDRFIETCLFNSRSTEFLFKKCSIAAVTLANNHVVDLGHDLSDTFRWLLGNNVVYFGAGNTSEEAEKPVIFEVGGVRMGVLGFGWSVIGCRPAKNKKSGVNPLTPHHVLSSIESFRSRHPSVRLALFMHWNYELELFPQPMHRQLAFDAIDAGADAIIGCHSHCVQAVEYHRGRPVVYGLGNWFLAEGVFKRGNLCFPEFARTQLAFELGEHAAEDKCHLFEYEPKKQFLQFRETVRAIDFAGVNDSFDFRGLSHEEYISWFGKHRRKRKVLPIYKDWRASYKNRILDGWVQGRQRVIDVAVALRLKKGPR